MPLTRQARKEYSRKHRKENPEIYRAAGRRYREKNLEKERARSREYANAHQDHRTEYMREWRKNNPERVKELGRNQYWKDPETARARNRIKAKALKGTPRYTYTTHKYRAKKRKIKFDLTYEQFMLYWQKQCHYCNEEIKTIGLDRVDSSIGYTVNNIVPCHYACNVAKSDMSQKDFIALCIRVVKVHDERRVK